MRNKIDAEIRAAVETCEAFLSSLPAHRSKYRLNCIRIIEICRELVSARPAQEPSSTRVAESGGIRYGQFPRHQTILNYYSDFLRVWHNTYDRIVDIAAPRLKKGASTLDFSKAELSDLDSGTSGRIQLMQQMLRESRAEINALLHIIRESVPVTEGSMPDLDSPLYRQHRDSLASWLNGLSDERRGLILSDVGIKSTSHLWPGRIVASPEFVEAIAYFSRDLRHRSGCD